MISGISGISGISEISWISGISVISGLGGRLGESWCGCGGDLGGRAGGIRLGEGWVRGLGLGVGLRLGLGLGLGVGLWGRARGRARLVSVRFIFVSGSFRVRFGLMSEDISFGSDEFSEPHRTGIGMAESCWEVLGYAMGLMAGNSNPIEG